MEILIAVLIMVVISLVIVIFWRESTFNTYVQISKRRFDDWKAEQEKIIRKDAIKRSQAVTIGKVTEHLIPYLPDFAYNPKDARFMGSPVDLVVFDGLSEGREVRVVFIEVKTGPNARLSPRERLVRAAIKDGQVHWEMLHTAQIG